MSNLVTNNFEQLQTLQNLLILAFDLYLWAFLWLNVFELV